MTTTPPGNTGELQRYTPGEAAAIPTRSGPIASQGMTGLVEGGATVIQTKAPGVTAVAVQIPRSLERYERSMRAEAERAASRFYFSWEVQTKKGPKIISGPTIKLANAALRNFYNVSLDIAIVHENADYWTFAAYVIDHETGASRPSLFRQRKPKAAMGKMSAERTIDMEFQKGQSKCARNAIMNYVPDYITDDLVEVAMKSEKLAVNEHNLPEKKAKALSYFVTKMSSMSEKEVLVAIEANIGQPYGKWMPSDVVGLREKRSALEEGYATFEELFPSAVKRGPDPLKPPEAESRPKPPPPADKKKEPEKKEAAPASDDTPPAAPPKEKPEGVDVAPAHQEPPPPSSPEPETQGSLPIDDGGPKTEEESTGPRVVSEANRPTEAMIKKYDALMKKHSITPEAASELIDRFSNGKAQDFARAAKGEIAQMMKYIIDLHDDSKASPA